MFRIVSRQFGYPMFAADLRDCPPWSDNPSEAYVYDHRDSRKTKLLYWRAVARNQGLDPASVEIEDVPNANVTH